MKTVTIKRSQAARFIEDLAEILGRWKTIGKDTPEEEKLQALEHMMKNQLDVDVSMPCTGAAHTNQYIDHCGVCSPSWGFVITKVKVR